LYKKAQIRRLLSDLPYLVATIFFIYVIYFIEHRYREEYAPKELTEHFQKVLKKKEAEAEKILDKILEAKIATENSGKVRGHQKYPGLDIPGWISVQIYKGDTLVFWSDNITPANKTEKGVGPGDERILRAGNGWYLLRAVNKDDMVILGMILLKHEYSVQNEFLSNRFQDDFRIPSAVSISLSNTGNKIFSAKGKFLFSLVFPKESLVSPKGRFLQETMILLCFIIAIILMVVFLKRCYDNFSLLIRGAGWRFLLFTTDVIILRMIQFYFRFPGPLYDTEFFGPALYSSSAFFPSLGDLVINITLLVLLSYFFCQAFTPVSVAEKRTSSKIVTVAITLLLILSGLAAGCWFLYDFIINSSFSLNLQDISSLNWTSLYGLLIIWGIWVSLFLVFWGIFKRFGFLSGPGENPHPSTIFILLILVAAVTTIISNYSNDYKEMEKRKILAVKLASTRNPVTEILFSQLEKRIRSDNRVIEIAGETDTAGNWEFQNDSIRKIIMSHMVSDYWVKYNVQITLCTENKKLQVQPQGYLVGCDEYFTKVIRDFGSKTLSEHLFFLDLGFGYENYLAIFPLALRVNGKASVLDLYLEINSKYIYKDLGYPELLINKMVADFPDISDYSCAFYQNAKLFHRIGKYAFCFDLEHYLDNRNGEVFFNFDGMNHYHYRI
jgi:two-component system nitrogen regulation sensor histidine kinase NtrY